MPELWLESDMGRTAGVPCRNQGKNAKENCTIRKGQKMDLTKLRRILDEHKRWIETNQREGSRADLRGADLWEADLWEADLREADLREANLREADLRGASLRGANLRRADLREADLRGASLRGADLREANLREADLREANLREADLRGASLRGANLRRADLREANLDYSCWPLWCGSLDVKVDKKIAAQLAYHFCRLDCDDPEYIKTRNAILSFANQFHRVNECGMLQTK